MTTPEAVIERQLEAYNARDLERFLAAYSDAIRVYRPPAVEPALAGKAAFGNFYATQRFNRAGLRAEVVRRIVLGNNVVDHERIYGVSEQPIEVVIVYEVVDGLVQSVWTFAAA